MLITDEDWATVDAFRTYVEDSTACDDRYGASSRDDQPDDALFVSLFDAGPSCWFAITVDAAAPRISVGLLVDGEAQTANMKRAIEELGKTVEELVEWGFQEAGLVPGGLATAVFDDDTDPTVCETSFEPEDLMDLDGDLVRNKTLRLLEAYLIAFGPAIFAGVHEEDDAFDFDFDDES